MSGGVLGSRDGCQRKRENGSAESSKTRRLYILEMSEHQAKWFARKFRSTSEMRLSIFVPFARIQLRPVAVGSTTMRTGVDADDSLKTALHK